MTLLAEENLYAKTLLLVVEERHRTADESFRGLEESTVETHHAVLVDFASNRDAELVSDVFRCRTNRMQRGGVAFKRRTLRRGVRANLVVLLEPFRIGEYREQVRAHGTE